MYRQVSNIRRTESQHLKDSRAVFAESLEARCQVENEDVVGAAPTGDAPTTSEWSTILLPTKVRLILEILRYQQTQSSSALIMTCFPFSAKPSLKPMLNYCQLDP